MNNWSKTMAIARAMERRKSLVTSLSKFAPFEEAGRKIESYLRAEVDEDGPASILEHLCACGVIPEGLGHDSTEEKVYSKYTDALLTIVFEAMGLKSVTLEERADSADVRVTASAYSFVADAKAFRLSRTAKNQKDFKIEAMDRWRGDCDHALVVAPVYQLPTTKSQIYEQATRRGVCLLTYTHLRAMLRAYQERAFSIEKRETALLAVLAAPLAVGASAKDAPVYWKAVNSALKRGHPKLSRYLEEESELEDESLKELKARETSTLKDMEAGIRILTREQAIAELIRARKLDERIRQIGRAASNDLLGI